MSDAGGDRPVVVVASERTAARWAARLVELGVAATAAPWSVICPGPDRELAGARLKARGEDAASRGRLVLLTSKHAVAFLDPGAGAGWRAVTVGAETAGAARAAGFALEPDEDLDSAQGFASVARRLVARHGPSRRAIWLRGESAHRGGVDVLAQAGWDVDELVVYAAEPRLRFDAEVRAALPARAWVVGSPAAARALRGVLGAREFPPAAGAARVFVRGETTAGVLRAPGRAEPEIVADLPDGLRSRLAGPTSPTCP